MDVTGANGEALPVSDEGHGREILLVHGGSNGPGDWDRVAARLSSRFRVLRFQRLTYRAEAPPAQPLMASETGDVLAVARAVGRPVVAAGHSSGAIVVLESALDEPSRFAGLVLYEPPVAVAEPLGGEALRRARAALERRDADTALDIFLRDIVQVPGAAVRVLALTPIWRRLRRSIAAQIADTEAIDSLGVDRGRYRDLHVPTLLLGGGLLSPAHLRTRLDALAAVLPCVDSVVRLRVHGHGAHYSAPGTLARIIGDFTARVHRER